jgi:LmbE family N-acetylglucosaminyl deacetylase
MKPGPNFPPEAAPLLAFGAHPDDVEFGCGGVVANETATGRPAHFVVCSRGESATHGTPAQRTVEAERAAALLGATLDWLELDGDAHLEIRAAHALKLAEVIRRLRPAIVLAPSLVENQHPDHARLGRLVRDAARLARYGGIAELRDLPSHAIGQLLFYAVTPEAEPKDIQPVVVNISSPPIIAAWTAAMEAHASQLGTRNYVELQLTRARLNGLRAGVEYATALYPNDALLVDSLAELRGSSRRF